MVIDMVCGTHSGPEKQVRKMIRAGRRVKRVSKRTFLMRPFSLNRKLAVKLPTSCRSLILRARLSSGLMSSETSSEGVTRPLAIDPWSEYGFVSGSSSSAGAWSCLDEEAVLGLPPGTLENDVTLLLTSRFSSSR